MVISLAMDLALARSAYPQADKSAEPITAMAAAKKEATTLLVRNSIVALSSFSSRSLRHRKQQIFFSCSCERETKVSGNPPQTLSLTKITFALQYTASTD